jgi:hypothetical protein
MARAPLQLVRRRSGGGRLRQNSAEQAKRLSRPAAASDSLGAMGDLIPFDPRKSKRRKWTRPEDFGHFPEPKTRRPARPVLPASTAASRSAPAPGTRKAARTALVWLVLLALIAATVLYSAYG